MSYKEVIDYLYSSLPVFHRVGPAALKPGLHNILELCRRLDNPQTKFKSIHIAGTNGKGSTSHMLAAVLQAAGFKTGLFTSPHLKSFTERSRVNGIEISEQEVVKFVLDNKRNFEEIKPSFFEMTAALAFDHFARSNVDIAVVEVGLGGRLDSTNIINPELCVITNISYDHENILGGTLKEIAGEKAGIIKKGVPTVVSEKQEEIENVFIQKAMAIETPLYFASEIYRCSNVKMFGALHMDVTENGRMKYSDLSCSLGGKYQLKNIPGVLAAVETLRSKGFKISDEQVRAGMSNVTELTGLKGRWQLLGLYPTIVCDTAHNEAGINEVMEQLQLQRYDKLHIVFGAVNDKDVDKILKLLPEKAHYYFCQANIPRALDAKVLFEKAKVAGLKGEVIPEVNKAVQIARSKASSEDFIFIGGSTFVVAEVEGI